LLPRPELQLLPLARLLLARLLWLWLLLLWLWLWLWLLWLWLWLWLWLLLLWLLAFLLATVRPLSSCGHGPSAQRLNAIRRCHSILSMVAKELRMESAKLLDCVSYRRVQRRFLLLLQRKTELQAEGKSDCRSAAHKHGSSWQVSEISLVGNAKPFAFPHCECPRDPGKLSPRWK
jgi:hypothetical protein